MPEPPVVFLLGLSGAGKTTLADWMALDLGFIHLDIDPGGADGITAQNLRSEWTAYGKGDPRAMADAIRGRTRAASMNGAVLSFPAMAFRREQLDAGASAGISTLILYGPGERCLSEFLERERRTGRGFDARRWHKFNDEPLKVYGALEFAKERIDAFRPDGSRWPRTEMITMVRMKLRL